MCSTIHDFEDFILDLTFLNHLKKLKCLVMTWNISSNSFLDSTSLYHQIEIDNHYTILVKYVLMLLLWICCYLADDEAPILNCPNISSTTDEGLNSSSTVLLSSTATDNVDFHLVVICSHSSEDIFLIGDTTVNCSSTDAAGNTDTCLLVVTVTGVNMIIFYVEKCRRRSGSGFWKMWFLLKD